MIRRTIPIAAVCAFIACAAQAQTNVAGTISTDANWSLAGSPYHVTDTLVVVPGATLTISPGVDVLFDADVELDVQGSLKAVGTEQDSIRFLPDSAAEWGGIRLNGGVTSSMAYCRVSGGHADSSDDFAASGGGILVSGTGTHLDLFHSVLSNNTARHDGGGIHVAQSATADIEYCTARDNVADAGGGIEFSGSAGSRIDNCVVTGNYANVGGGVVITDGSSAEMSQTLIADDSAWAGWGSLYVLNGATLSADHCTIVADSDGALFVYHAGSNATITNSILWSQPANGVFKADNGVIAISYSDVSAGYSGTGNISSDPLFVDAVNGNYHLSPLSPCIDAGDPSAPPDPDGSRADMGAFYSGAVALSFGKVRAFPGDTVAVTVNATGDSVGPADMAFVFDSSALTPLADGFIVSHAFTSDNDALVRANVIGDTVRISLSVPIADVRTFDNEPLVTVAFVANADIDSVYHAPLTWLPAPDTNVGERSATLTDGFVVVAPDMHYGDVTGDGTISALDAAMVLQYVVRIIPTIDIVRADVTGDGTVSSTDAAYILQRTLDPSYPFPVEQGLLARPTDQAPALLSWVRSGSSWELRADEADGLVAGEITMTLPNADAVTVDGGDMSAFKQDGETLHVAFVRLDPSHAVLFRVQSSASVAPTITDARLNEGAMALGGVTRPLAFSLAQNTPNPFNPSTTITFDLPESGHARLAIYTVSGQVVRVLVNEQAAAGEHTVAWDARDDAGRAVSSGVYLYRLTAGSNSAVGKMTLLR